MATIQEARELGLMQLYSWSNADDMIQSQYGHIKIKEWLEREQARIAADASRQAVVVTHGHRMTLYVNDTANDFADRGRFSLLGIKDPIRHRSYNNILRSQ